MIPKNDHEKEFLERIQKLERERFGGTKEENYQKPISAREQMQTNDDREKSDNERQHVGSDSYETLRQELRALQQEKKAFRDDAWLDRLHAVNVRISNTELDANQKRNLSMMFQQLEAGVV